MRPRSKDETLAIPDDVRAAVDERDSGVCRVCGKYLGDRRALHHIVYGGDHTGMGGRRQHDPDLILTVCWLPGDNDCHALVHSNKGLWMPLLLAVVQRRSLTALQLKRWSERDRRERTRPGTGRTT